MAIELHQGSIRGSLSIQSYYLITCMLATVMMNCRRILVAFLIKPAANGHVLRYTRCYILRREQENGPHDVHTILMIS